MLRHKLNVGTRLLISLLVLVLALWVPLSGLGQMAIVAALCLCFGAMVRPRAADLKSILVLSGGMLIGVLILLPFASGSGWLAKIETLGRLYYRSVVVLFLIRIAANWFSPLEVRQLLWRMPGAVPRSILIYLMESYVHLRQRIRVTRHAIRLRTTRLPVKRLPGLTLGLLLRTVRDADRVAAARSLRFPGYLPRLEE